MTVILGRDALLDRPWTLSYDEYLDAHGPLPALTAGEIRGAVEAAGLRGRGGAGFPLARKMRTAAEAPGRPLVIANGTEGEPAIAKDASLLMHVPHLVLDGLALAVRAVGGRHAVVAVHPGLAAEAIKLAVSQRRDRVRVHVVPPGYVSGEASAVTSSVLGGDALPTVRDVPLAVRGPRGRPVLVQNVETLAALAIQARHPGRPTTVLLTVRGREVQVLEVPVGVTIGAVLDIAGETDVQAVLAGGYAGIWLPAPRALDVPVSHAAGTLGAGLLLALPHDVCGVAGVAQVTRYLAGQSAGQCGPCINGLPALAVAWEALAAGDPPAATLARIERLANLVDGRGACGLPGGTAAMVRTALEAFAEDIGVHLTAHCGRRSPELPR
jgi:NADH:ubiquinone oxidoreductase subunit F (NADH-binding)